MTRSARGRLAWLMVFGALVLVLCPAGARGSEETPSFDFSSYHSNEQILHRMEEECEQSSLCSARTLAGSQVRSFVLSAEGGSKAHAGADPQRLLAIFGEHGRELISSESGMAFLSHLLSEEHQAISEGELQVLLVPIVNAEGRARVTEGQYCLRVNQHGVDLNRNWDAHWEKGDDKEHRMMQTFPGSKPFSEAETRALRDAAKDFDPTLFFTVHSGALTMFTPHVYDESGVGPEPLRLLQKAQEESDIDCPVGPAARQLHYRATGTCLDYLYDELGVANTFGFEIFVGETQSSGSCFLQGVSPRMSRLHATVNARTRRLRRQSHAHAQAGSLVQRGDSRLFPEPASSDDWECLEQFNPSSKEQYEQTLRRWNDLYTDVVRRARAE